MCEKLNWLKITTMLIYLGSTICKANSVALTEIFIFFLQSVKDSYKRLEYRQLVCVKLCVSASVFCLFDVPFVRSNSGS